VDEARPPRRVARISVFSGVLRQECFAEAPLEQSDRRSCVCGLRVIGSWWRSSGCRSGLQRTASLAWLIVGDDDAVLGGFFSFLSQFVVVVV
jgi:hypothetical protein